jgi:hypothetical protein
LYTDSNFRERLEKGCSKVPGICSWRDLQSQKLKRIR